MPTPDNATRQRILDVAEQLFAERGYASVSLRDIAKAVGLQHGSLYYYLPDGKEQLYIEVVKRNVRGHQSGMQMAIQGASNELREQLRAAAGWLLSQPPLDLMRMRFIDVISLDENKRRELFMFIFETIREPVETAIRHAQESGLVHLSDPGLAAIVFITSIEAIHLVPPDANVPLAAIANDVIEMSINGWLKR